MRGRLADMRLNFIFDNTPDLATTWMFIIMAGGLLGSATWAFLNKFRVLRISLVTGIITVGLVAMGIVYNIQPTERSVDALRAQNVNMLTTSVKDHYGIRLTNTEANKLMDNFVYSSGFFLEPYPPGTAVAITMNGAQVKVKLQEQGNTNIWRLVSTQRELLPVKS